MPLRREVAQNEKASHRKGSHPAPLGARGAADLEMAAAGLPHQHRHDRLQRRRAENAWFLTKFVYPVQRRRSTGRQQRMDKDHKYFTCPNCRTVCRVPRGKGKIVITCPKCRREIHGRS